MPKFRGIRFWPDPIIAHVDEHLLAMGRDKLFHLRSHVPCLVHASFLAIHSGALSFAPLLYGIPRDHFPWLPPTVCLAAYRGAHSFPGVAIPGGVEHQEGHAHLQVYSLTAELK